VLFSGKTNAANVADSPQLENVLRHVHQGVVPLGVVPLGVVLLGVVLLGVVKVDVTERMRLDMRLDSQREVWHAIMGSLWFVGMQPQLILTPNTTILSSPHGLPFLPVIVLLHTVWKDERGLIIRLPKFRFLIDVTHLRLLCTLDHYILHLHAHCDSALDLLTRHDFKLIQILILKPIVYCKNVSILQIA
jgi:hypothetical protein